MGFGIVRSKAVRVFLGPTAYLSVGKMDEAVIDGIYGAGANQFFRSDPWYMTAGVGPTLGLNLHLGRRLTASATVGYEYQGSFLFPTGIESGSEAIVFTGGVHRALAGLKLYFRGADDQFE